MGSDEAFIADAVKVQDSADAVINPATKEGQDAIISHLEEIRDHGQTTLSYDNEPLGAAGTYSTGWIDTRRYPDLYFFWYAYVEPASVTQSWSDDGVNPVRDPDTLQVSVFAGPSPLSTQALPTAYIVNGVPSRPKVARYVKYDVTNGATPQTSPGGGLAATETFLWGLDQPFTGSYSTYDAPITEFALNSFLLSRSVQMAQQPDGDVVNARADGAAVATTTPLNGDAVFTSDWIDTDGWRTLQIYVGADVEGELAVQYTDDAGATTPTVRATRTYEFDAEDIARGFRTITLTGLLDGVRLIYTNGPTAQTEFLLELDLRTTPSDVPRGQIGVPLDGDDDTVLSQSVLLARDSSGIINELNTGGTGEGLDVHVTGHKAETPLRPLNSVNTGQGTVTSASAVPIPSAGAGLLNRKTIEYSNHSNTVNVYWKQNGTVTSGNGKILRPGADVSIEVDESVDIYWIAEDTGGSSLESDESGATTTGTADTTNNALTSNDTRTLFDNGETLEVDGFTYTKTLTDINTLRIGVEGRKASTPATQTAAFVDVVGNTAGNVTSIASPSVTANDDHHYVVAISRREEDAAIASVTGMGLTWEFVADSTDPDPKNRTSIYQANGSPSTGAVTASFSQSATNCTIIVARFSDVDLDNPIENSESIFLENDSSYSDSIDGTDKGLLATFVGVERRTHTVGSGATEQTEIGTGTGNNDARITLNTRALTTTGAAAYSGTMSGGAKGSVIAITFNPAATPATVFDVEFDDGEGAGYQSVGSLTFDSTSDDTQFIDISGLHTLTEATINATTIRLTRNSTGSAQGEVDWVYLEVTEGDEDSAARISYAEVADSDYPQ